MGKFISHILIFIGCFILTCLCLVQFSLTIVDKNTFKTPQHKNILLLGDSHVECAINDSIFENSINMAHSGEAYIYTYTKLKLFTKLNSQIDTVLLSFNFGSLLPTTEKWIYNHDGLYNIDRLWSFFDEEQKEIFQSNAYYYRSILRTPYTYRQLIMAKIKGIESSYKMLNIGGYNKLDKNKLQQHIDKYGSIYKNRKNEYQNYKQSLYQIHYLNKIVDYCKTNNIQLIFINTPVYMEFQYGVDEYYSFYNTHYSSIPLWDYSSLPLNRSSYADIEHLNIEGAQIFSEILKKKRE